MATFDRPAGGSEVEMLVRRAEGEFEHDEVLKDLVDECIDLSLDYRQSGHPRVPGVEPPEGWGRVQRPAC